MIKCYSSVRVMSKLPRIVIYMYHSAHVWGLKDINNYIFPVGLPCYLHTNPICILTHTVNDQYNLYTYVYCMLYKNTLSVKITRLSLKHQLMCICHVHATKRCDIR